MARASGGKPLWAHSHGENVEDIGEARSEMVNAPVSHDTLNFTGTIVHANTNMRDIEPSGVDTRA